MERVKRILRGFFLWLAKTLYLVVNETRYQQIQGVLIGFPLVSTLVNSFLSINEKQYSFKMLLNRSITCEMWTKLL